MNYGYILLVLIGMGYFFVSQKITQVLNTKVHGGLWPILLIDLFLFIGILISTYLKSPKSDILIILLIITMHTTLVYLLTWFAYWKGQHTK